VTRGRAAGSRLPSTADPVYYEEEPDLWGTEPDEPEKHKSVQKLLSEPLLHADPSAGLARHGQRGAAEEAPGKPGGLVPSGDAAGARTGRSQNRSLPPPHPQRHWQLLQSPSSERLRSHVVPESVCKPLQRALGRMLFVNISRKREKKWGFKLSFKEITEKHLSTALMRPFASYFSAFAPAYQVWPNLKYLLKTLASFPASRSGKSAANAEPSCHAS